MSERQKNKRCPVVQCLHRSRVVHTRVCHCETGWAGAVIQLKFQMDGLVAALLAMTNRATLAHILNLPHFPCGP